MKTKREPSPIRRNSDGTVTWDQIPGDQYVVLHNGLYARGKREKLTFENWHQARAINIWSGSKYLLRDGKLYLIMTVTN